MFNMVLISVHSWAVGGNFGIVEILGIVGIT